MKSGGYELPATGRIDETKAAKDGASLEHGRILHATHRNKTAQFRWNGQANRQFGWPYGWG